MLQPRQSQADPLMVSRMLWGALCLSTLIYGFVLFTTGKVSGVFFPQGELLPVEMAAMAMNLVALGVFFFHKNSVVPQKDFQKKFPGYIVCWAMNESIAIVGFVAVFITETGNGFFYVTNVAVALISNLLTLPKK